MATEAKSKSIKVKFQSLASTLGGVPVIAPKSAVRPYLFPAEIEVESGTLWGELIRTVLHQNIKLRHGPMLAHCFCVNGKNLKDSLSEPITQDSTVVLLGLVPRAKDLSAAFAAYETEHHK